MRDSERLRTLPRKVLLASLLVCATLGLALATPQDAPNRAPVGSRSFVNIGHDAVGALVKQLYGGNGLWHDCASAMCATHNQDWGSDSLTDTLYLRWATTHDAALLPLLSALARSGRLYAAPCRNRPCELTSQCGIP